MKVTIDVPLDVLHIIKDTIRGNIACDFDSRNSFPESDVAFKKTEKFWRSVRKEIELQYKKRRK